MTILKIFRQIFTFFSKNFFSKIFEQFRKFYFSDHIIDMSDENGDNLISLEEMLGNHDLWVDSDATQFGQQLRWAHDEL